MLQMRFCNCYPQLYVCPNTINPRSKNGIKMAEIKHESITVSSNFSSKGVTDHFFLFLDTF